MKEIALKTILGSVGSTIALCLGGWDMALQTLVAFMTIDYLTGLYIAVVLKKSNKSECGAFNSSVGFRGLAKKGVMLLMVYMATRLELSLNIQSGFVRNTVIIALTINEFGSISENFAIIGVPMPKALMQAIDILKKKDGEKENETK